MYLGLGIVFLIFSLLLAAGIIVTLIRSAKNGGDLISKKNLLYLAPTFLIIYLLHITASAFNGEDIDFFYCFSLIYTTLDVLRFKAVKDLLMPICEAFPIYYLDFVIAFVVGGAAVILSIASFFSRRIANCFKVKRLLKKNCDLVVGASESALKYIRQNKNCVMLGARVTRQRYAELIKEGVPVMKCPFEIKRIAPKLKRGRHNLIAFRDGNCSYTDLIEQFSALKKSGCDVHIHLEAYQDEMKILKEKFVSKTDKSVYAHVSCFSKYELMARRFVADYPVTKFIPRSFFNENLTVKKGKQINVVFVGFGKVNYQLFRMCAMQFQFAQEKQGKLCSLPVRYHIFDNDPSALHNEFFSRIQYEFDREFKDCDFPKPEKICELNIYKTDTNSVEAKQKFCSLVTKDSFTCFIISLEGDLEDASYAQTIKRLMKDEDNYRIFVRAKNDSGEALNSENDSIIYFGEEKKLFTHDNIVNDGLTELARRINLLYSRISTPPEWLKNIRNATPREQCRLLNESLKSETNRELMLEKWEELPFIEQASNLYHALNLPFKLNLLGFDMVKMKDENDKGVSEEVYNRSYVNSGRVNDYSDYSTYFEKNSGNVLAFIEHSRWNALYILYDYTQMKKRDMQIADGNMIHKNVGLKQHACITTYYGLDELVKYKFKTLYPGEKIKNGDPRLIGLGKVYRYDYMDLDRLYAEITATGYKLVENN